MYTFTQSKNFDHLYDVANDENVWTASLALDLHGSVTMESWHALIVRTGVQKNSIIREFKKALPFLHN